MKENKHLQLVMMKSIERNNKFSRFQKNSETAEIFQIKKCHKSLYKMKRNEGKQTITTSNDDIH